MAKKLRIPKKTYERKAYYDRYSHYHPAKTITRKSHLVKDKGEPGRTPEKEKWFAPTVTMDWTKDMLLKERRANALLAHGNNYLSTARALQALANVTTDKETKIEARKDAKYFFRKHKVEGN